MHLSTSAGRGNGICVRLNKALPKPCGKWRISAWTARAARRILVQAYFWLTLAASRGIGEAVHLRNRLHSKQSREASDKGPESDRPVEAPSREYP